MIVWAKAAIVIGGLYALVKYTNTGSAIYAELRRCPEGSVPGPWFSCRPNCDASKGEFIAVSPGFTGIPAGTLYCAHHGTVTDENGGSGTNIDPTGNTAPGGIAATGVNGNTISVRVAGQTQTRIGGYG